MGWVKDALKELSETGRCEIRHQGGSMKGRIESGQLVTIVKIKPEEIEDVAFVKWKGNYLLHIIKEIKEEEVKIIKNEKIHFNSYWVSAFFLCNKTRKV